jgi:hypothetical protein
MFQAVRQVLALYRQLSGLSNEYVLHCKEFLDGLSQIDSVAVASSMKYVREHGLNALPSRHLMTL